MSLAFLKEAMRHFVCMTYRAKSPNRMETELRYASCFVIEAEGQWLLVTAGHVINDMKKASQRGYELTEATLHDKLAGHQFKFGLPFALEIDEWVVIEDDSDGADYAALILSPLTVQGLFVGGVRPIDQGAWSDDKFESFQHWLLVGIPAETHEVSNGQLVLKPTLMVLKPTEQPSEILNLRSEKVFGRLITRPEQDQVVVSDIGGMSGGPVFGLRVVEGKLRYWLFGVQSSWLPQARVVGICPMLRFLLAIENALRMAAASVS
jgi:hypothetical protein